MRACLDYDNLDSDKKENSACIGGIESACQPGLQGPFCLLCINTSGVYYAPATNTLVAQCKECGSSLPVTIVAVTVVLLALCIAVAVGPRVCGCYGNPIP